MRRKRKRLWQVTTKTVGGFREPVGTGGFRERGAGTFRTGREGHIKKQTGPVDREVEPKKKKGTGRSLKKK